MKQDVGGQVTQLQQLAGAPPPAMGRAVAPQFPYDPDPGSITWMDPVDSADVDDARWSGTTNV